MIPVRLTDRASIVEEDEEVTAGVRLGHVAPCLRLYCFWESPSSLESVTSIPSCLPYPAYPGQIHYFGTDNI